MANHTYTEAVADKIIAYWTDKVKGKKLLFGDQEVVIDTLYKDPQGERFSVRIYTKYTHGSKDFTSYTDELKDALYSLMMIDEISNFNWETGEEMKSES